jgi:uncharacterized protein
MKSFLIIGAAGVASLTVALVPGRGGTGDAASAATAAVRHSIVVNGNGAVTTVPDRAQISVGVSTNAKTASAALHRNAADMTRVIAALKSQGIADADIRTELVSLSSRYAQNGGAVVGYTAANSVSATLHNLGRVGPVIDAAVDAGATEVSGPNLVRSDAAALYRAALRAAITNAKGKAQAIAAASGLHLRRVTDVTENGANPVTLPLTGDRAASTPVEPGTSLVEATVTVTFAAS